MALKQTIQFTVISENGIALEMEDIQSRLLDHQQVSWVDFEVVKEEETKYTDEDKVFERQDFVDNTIMDMARALVPDAKHQMHFIAEVREALIREFNLDENEFYPSLT